MCAANRANMVLSSQLGNLDRYEKGGLVEDDEFWQAGDCERHTGIKAGTWRFWASTDQGPASFRLGRRRVWRKSVILAWVAEQEKNTVRGGGDAA